MDEEMVAQLEALELKDAKEMEKELGRGSYGVVVEVKVNRLRCAGKKIHDAFLTNVRPEEKKSMISQFMRECLHHAKFRHPNIVQVIGIHSGPDSTIPMLILEYMHTSLDRCLESIKDIPVSLKHRMLLDVSYGLRYLHEQQPTPFIHRDLTAKNVLLSEGMRAKIADFGVARVLAKQGATMTRAPGTQAYMPPEATVQNPQYGTKLDIFSFGILMVHVILQTWPLPLCGETKPNPSNPDKLIPVSHVEMRAEYFEQMGAQNELTPISKECLRNNPDRRPDIGKIQDLLLHLVTRNPFPLPNSLEALVELKSKEARIRELEESLQTCEAQIQAVLEESKVRTSLDGAELHHLTAQLQYVSRRIQPVLKLNEAAECPFIITHPSNPSRYWKVSDGSSVAQFELTVRPPLNIRFGAAYVKAVISNPNVVDPRGIAVTSDGVVFVVENNGQKGIHVCHPDGTMRAIVDSATYIDRSTPKNKCWHPRGIAIDGQGDIYLVDTGSHRVLKFSPDGVTCLATVGIADTPGNDSGQFNHPRGIAVAPSGEVYVCDQYNNRIQVFTSDLKFVREFGKEGNGPLEFRQPFDVAVDSSGRIYVVDCCNSCVKIFSKDFVPVGKIGGAAQPITEILRKPVAICIDINENIFVADYDKHCVFVFNSRHEFKMHFGNYGSREGLFNHPVALASDQCGRVYVSDEWNHRVVMYK